MKDNSSVKMVEQTDAGKDEKLPPFPWPSPFHSVSDLQPYIIMSCETPRLLLSHIKLKSDNHEQWATSILTRMRGTMGDINPHNRLLMGRWTDYHAIPLNWLIRLRWILLLCSGSLTHLCFNYQFHPLRRWCKGFLGPSEKAFLYLWWAEALWTKGGSWKLQTKWCFRIWLLQTTHSPVRRI